MSATTVPPLPPPQPRADVGPLGRAEVAIIVLNWNRREETLACVQSLHEADLGGAPIYVVDNGSRDGSVEAVRERFPDVHVIALPINQGFAGGNNAGIRAALEAGARAVFLLNNDTIVAPDFLGHLLGSVNSNLLVGAVSSVTLRMDKPELLDAAYLSIYFGHGIVWHHGVNALPGEGFDRPTLIEAGIGSGMLLTETALRTVGLLDEDYFAYHEEVDWCVRARAAGFVIAYQPYSRIWHHGSRSTDVSRPARPKLVADDEPQLPNPVPLSWSPVRSYLGARNSVRFVRKHATRKQMRYFIHSTLHHVPLEYLAAVMGREEEYEIGVWTYPRVAEFYFLNRHGVRLRDHNGKLAKLWSVLKVAPLFPIDLFWSLPRHILAAHREGHIAQPREVIRGLWDGLLNRPLPLERLGLR